MVDTLHRASRFITKVLVHLSHGRDGPLFGLILWLYREPLIHISFPHNIICSFLFICPHCKRWKGFSSQYVKLRKWLEFHLNPKWKLFSPTFFMIGKWMCVFLLSSVHVLNTFCVELCLLLLCLIRTSHWIWLLSPAPKLSADWVSWQLTAKNIPHLFLHCSQYELISLPPPITMNQVEVSCPQKKLAPPQVLFWEMAVSFAIYLSLSWANERIVFFLQQDTAVWTDADPKWDMQPAACRPSVQRNERQ